MISEKAIYGMNSESENKKDSNASDCNLNLS